MSLAEYMRFVSYMYLYDKGMKTNNTGFARVDNRDNVLKMTISIKDVLSSNNRDYEAYLVFRNETDDIGIKIGDIEIKNGTGELKVTDSANNIKRTGKNIQDAGAIIVIGKDKNSGTILKDIVYGTEWDDIPIKIDKIKYNEIQVAQANNKPKSKNSIQEIMNDGVKENNQIQPINNGLKKESIAQPINNKMEMPQEIKNISETNTELEQNQYETNIYDNGARDNKMSGNENGAMESELEGIFNNNEYLNSKSNLYATNIMEEEQEERKKYERKNKIIEVIHKQIFKEYPQMNPFEDKNVVESVQVEPYDVSLLPMDKWTFGNNSFVLNGYHQYRHLILAKVLDKNEEKYFYMLGVPGLNYMKERQLAAVYGFEDFKPVKDVENSKGEFGYWYIKTI